MTSIVEGRNGFFAIFVWTIGSIYDHKTMKRLFSILILLWIVFPVAAQVGHVYKGYPDNISSFSYYITVEDPVFDYIATYAPSYYFEEVEIGEKSSVKMTVRTFFNYDDSKSLSQIILTTESGEMFRENSWPKTDDFCIWESIDPEEIAGIQSFLSSVAPLKSRYGDPMTRVYNTNHGLLFLAKGSDITLRFPETRVIREINAYDWIPLFENARKLISDVMQDAEGFGFESESPYSQVAVRVSLEGRSVLGSVPKPHYSSSAEGVVVVQIKVDQYGTVTEAIPGAEGTTVKEKRIWTVARNAARRTHFNQNANSPAQQLGTITYIFKLN